MLTAHRSSWLCHVHGAGPKTHSSSAALLPATAGGTRTCIHTPGAPLDPAELSSERLASVLDGAALVYFDGRLTEAALLQAREARAHGVPVRHWA